MRSLSLMLTLVWCATLTGAENWPQFRGPTGQGLAEAVGVPTRWSESENIAWKTLISGRGWSSPVVWDDRIWLTTAIETAAGDQEREKKLTGQPQPQSLALAASVSLRAVCVDRATGAILHDVELFRAEDPDPIHLLNSYASPTPVIEAGRLYAHFGTYGTACVDTRQGTILWKAQLPVMHNVGPGSSPVLYKDLLVLVCDGADKQYVAALDKYTGKTVWKTDRPPLAGSNGDFHKAYCTPLVVQSGGRDQVVIPGAQWVVSYEPESGKPLWQVNYGSGFSNVPRPVFGDGLVYICTGFTTHELWAMRVDGQGDVTGTHVVWKQSKQIPDKPSPLLVGRELYVISGRGVASCFDAASGDTLWRERMPGNFSASPVYAEGRIYFSSQEGSTTVVQARRTYAELAQNQIDGRLMASPAIVGRAIYLRSDTHLYRIESPE